MVIAILKGVGIAIAFSVMFKLFAIVFWGEFWRSMEMSLDRVDIKRVEDIDERDNAN